METRLVFLLAVIAATVAWAMLAAVIVWPRLRTLPRTEALRWVAFPQAFRFVGLSFIVSGVVSPMLPAAFAVPDAWGDIAAVVLALLAITALTRRWSLGIALMWLLSLWGTFDLLRGYYLGMVNNIDAGAFGAAYFLPTFVVPGLLLAHILAFLLLLRPHTG